MKLLIIASLCVVVALAATPSPACPSYEAAVDVCHNFTKMTSPKAKCGFWRCVSTFCDAPFVRATLSRACGILEQHFQNRPARPAMPLPAQAVVRHTPLVGTPNVASPCGGGSGSQTPDQIRHWLLDTSMNVYYDRADEHYTEGNQRWSGISGHVCPPHAPTYSDCSSTVTWIYWTLFGNGADFMNGENWSAGYTGTLDQHGTAVGANTADLAIGDLCFYYHPMHHVAIYVGGGKVVSHGMDPVGYYPFDYAPIDFCRRYI